MKKLSLVLIISVIITLTFSAHATEGQKIGFIQTQKVILETKAGKEGYVTLEKLVEELKQRMQSKESSIKAMEEELAKQGKMLSDDARLEKREELQKAYKDYSRMKEDAKVEIGNREKALLDKIIEQLAAVIEQVGKNEGYTLILDAEGPSVLFADSAQDISPLIVKEFDKASQ
ncbi:OmpH family outer membrane protein [bacterium]|nr:OmpH family outer membrane protein [bacterium]